jgi:gamma-glutamyl-gamma-aminobutyrate hydrolase PuuD
MTSLTLGYAGTGTGTHAPFNQVIPNGLKCNVSDIYAGKITHLVIWGGEDISPSLYDEKASTYTHAGDKPSTRDKLELDLCMAAVNCNIPIIGVCRGAQLLCAIAGGKLVQHVTGHHTAHEILTATGRSVITSSVHHQMMFPWDTEHELLAWSPTQLSRCYIGQDDKDIKEAVTHVEPEIVYFPKIKGLAIQGHPEFMDKGDEFVILCNELVTEYLMEKKE